MGSVITKESFEPIHYSTGNKCDSSEKIPEQPSSEVVLPFDPRSPSTEFNRTPIQVCRKDSSVEKKNVESLQLFLNSDPRSPTVEVARTPIFVDPRSPTSKICRTPIDETNHVDWEVEVEKLKELKLNSCPQETDNDKKDIISSTPLSDHVLSDVKPPRPKKLFDESINRPLSNVTNSRVSARTPTQILQRKQGKNVKKALKRASIDFIDKENDYQIMSQ